MWFAFSHTHINKYKFFWPFYFLFLISFFFLFGKFYWMYLQCAVKCVLCLNCQIFLDNYHFSVYSLVKVWLKICLSIPTTFLCFTDIEDKQDDNVTCETNRTVIPPKRDYVPTNDLHKQQNQQHHYPTRSQQHQNFQPNYQCKFFWFIYLLRIII